MSNAKKSSDTASSPLDTQLKELQIEQARVNLNKSRRTETKEAIYQDADLRRMLAAAESAELDLAKKRRESDRELASAEENLTYTFYDDVSDESVKACLAELAGWSRRFPGKSITIVLNSPGGRVIDGLALFDYILKLRADGHHVTIVVLGLAASMGGILLQAGDRRLVGKYSHMLIHEVSSGTSGSLPEMEDRVAYYRSLWHQSAEILAERSILTAAEVRNRAQRKDWWLTAAESVELGFADEILSAPAPIKVKKGSDKKGSAEKSRRKGAK